MGIERTGVELEKKARVLEVAKELFARFGFRKATAEAIAVGAGISKRTLYELFSSKEAILAELVMAEARAFRKTCLGQMKGASSAAAKLRILCDLSSRYFDENPFLGQVLADDAGLYAPFLGDTIHEVEAGIKGIIAITLRDGVRTGELSAMDVNGVAQCILVLFRGFTYRRAAEDGRAEWVPFILSALAACD